MPMGPTLDAMVIREGFETGLLRDERLSRYKTKSRIEVS
jgi:hypothetical protein